MAQPTASAPTLRNYAYLRPLGSGGFADVFLYEQVRPRREVAVKVLRTATPADPHDLRRDTEADLMATVSRHPYIVTVLEADVAPDGREYIVMEYYPGQSLAARVRQGPLSTAEVLRIGIQLCGAVETAHRHGIVHRDIKPANILTDAYQHPKLTDFGIAGRRGERGDGAMSPPWSAPEIISGRAAPDESTDVYSLAAHRSRRPEATTPRSRSAAGQSRTRFPGSAGRTYRRPWNAFSSKRSARTPPCDQPPRSDSPGRCSPFSRSSVMRSWSRRSRTMRPLTSATPRSPRPPADRSWT
jgi:serine/threonine protein kinase